MTAGDRQDEDNYDQVDYTIRGHHAFRLDSRFEQCARGGTDNVAVEKISLRFPKGWKKEVETDDKEYEEYGQVSLWYILRR